MNVTFFHSFDQLTNIFIYFLLENAVSYEPSIFPLIYGPSTKRVGHESTGKKRGSVTYRTDQENDVSKIFIISLRLIGHRKGN